MASPAKKAPELTKEQRFTLIRNAREESALQTLEGFTRFCWGVIEGDTSDGMDDVRELLGMTSDADVGDAKGDTSDAGAGVTNLARERAGKTLVWNWHLGLICEELEWLARGYTDDGERVDELHINIPPGHLKSRLSSVMFPAWLWLQDPGYRLWCGANDGDLAKRDSRYMRTLIMSERYKRLQRRQCRNRGLEVEVVEEPAKAPKYVIRDADGKDVTEANTWTVAKDQFEKINYANTRGGERYAASINGTVTGKRCDGQIIDDPHDAKAVMLGSPEKVAERMREVQTVFNGVLSTRVNRGGWRLVIMQRLHTDDLSGSRLDLANEPGSGVRAVVLPARYDPDHPHVHPKDPRTMPGELLFPAWHGEEEDAAALKSLTPRHYDAQFGQAPRKGAGGQFKAEWFLQRYTVPPWTLLGLAKFRQVAISVDCNFKKGKKNSYVVLQVWAHLQASGIANRPKATGLKPGKYLLDQIRGQMSFTETLRALRLLRQKWQLVTLVLVEEKANGSAVIDTMREEGHPGVVGYNPAASKEARAEISALAFEAHEIWLPQDQYAPWLVDYIDEHETFPGGTDDQVDSTSQMMIRWGVAEMPKSTTDKLGFLAALTGMS